LRRLRRLDGSPNQPQAPAAGASYCAAAIIGHAAVRAEHVGVEGGHVGFGGLINGGIRVLKKGTPQRESVDVNEIIREMIVLLRSEVTRHSVSFRAELAADLPQIMGDRVQLQQVMMNLITNSIDAMKAAIAHRAHP
jgi:hypothetical protein